MADLGAAGIEDMPESELEDVRDFGLTQDVMADMIPVLGVDADETIGSGGSGSSSPAAVGYATAG